MKKKIIALYGTAGSGKDYICSMLQFFFEHFENLDSIQDKNKFISVYSDFIKWIEENVNKSPKTGHFKNSVRYAFADTMKEALRYATGIPLSYFHNSQKKDKLYVNLNTFKVVNYLPETAVRLYTDVEAFEEKQKMLSAGGNHEFVPGSYMTLRDMMTYFGTYLCRNFLSNDIWINAVFEDIDLVKDADYISIITDIRFPNEFERAKEESALIIEIKNPKNEKSVGGIAESSYEKFKPDFVFENCVDDPIKLMVLFHQLMKIIFEYFESESI